MTDVEDGKIVCECYVGSGEDTKGEETAIVVHCEAHEMGFFLYVIKKKIGVSYARIQSHSQ